MKIVKVGGLCLRELVKDRDTGPKSCEVIDETTVEVHNRRAARLTVRRRYCCSKLYKAASCTRRRYKAASCTRKWSSAKIWTSFLAVLVAHLTHITSIDFLVSTHIIK